MKELSCGQGAVSGRGARVGGPLVSELAAAHGVHRSWIYKLLARYRAGARPWSPAPGAALLPAPDAP